MKLQKMFIPFDLALMMAAEDPEAKAAFKRQMRGNDPKTFRFTLEELADYICQYIEDGKRTRNCDVVAWFRWFEKKCGLKRSYIIGKSGISREKVGT